MYVIKMMLSLVVLAILYSVFGGKLNLFGVTWPPILLYATGFVVLQVMFLMRDE